MSETRDVSGMDTRSIPMNSSNTENPIDFGPLVEDDEDDFDITQIPPHLRPRRRRRRWVFWLILLLLLVLIGGGIFTYLTLSAPPPITYAQTAVTTGNLTVSVAGTGPVQAGAIYNLNFTTSSAQIQTIKVHVGQQVKKGDTLATVDPTTLKDAIAQAQNTVNAAQTSLNNAYSSQSSTNSQESTAINVAYINEQNALKACTTTPTSGGGGGVTATPTPTPTPDPQTIANCETLAKDQYSQAVNQANSSVNNAGNQVTSAQQQLTNAQTVLKTAQDNLTSATLIAPSDGVIESINGLVGETPGSGSGSGSSGSSAFMVLVDASTLNVAAQISEANIASIAVNQPVTFTVAAYPSQTYRASVASIDTLGTTTSSVVSYLVNLAVDMQSIGTSHVYPGMTATVSITTAERIGALLVPVAALSFEATALQDKEITRSQLTALVAGGQTTTTGGSRGIVIELKNGKLVPVLVTTGLTNGQYTEIVSGVQEGTQLVTSQTGGRTTTTTTTSGSSTGGGTGGGFGGGRGGGGGGGFGGGGN